MVSVLWSFSIRYSLLPEMTTKAKIFLIFLEIHFPDRRERRLGGTSTAHRFRQSRSARQHGQRVRKRIRSRHRRRRRHEDQQQQQ